MSARVPAVATLLLTMCVPLFPAAHPPTSKEKAWNLLQAGLQSKRLNPRLSAVRVLGLLPGDSTASKLAEDALQDLKPTVRVAAAGALGQMHATMSIPTLKELTNDKDLSVALAAAHALYVLKAPEGYELYFAVLTGRRKGGQGLIADQMQTLHDPAKMATIGLEQAIGYVPFAGIGWDALRTIMKKDPSPARAVAASILSQDPDPVTGQALVDAASDKNWIVRVAALDAIARRGDPDLEPKIELLLDDGKYQVRYAAAAAVLRLSAIAERQARKKK